MGYLTAYDTMEFVQDLHSAVGMHFASNCYPPVPGFMVPVAVEAIEAVANEEYGAPIALPEGVTFRGDTSAPAGEIVESYYLHAFVDYLINQAIITEEEN